MSLDIGMARAAITRWYGTGHEPPELDGPRGLLTVLARCVEPSCNDELRRLIDRYERQPGNVMVSVSALREILDGQQP